MKKTLTVIIMLIAFIGLGAAGCTQDTGNATIKPKPVELETPVAADFDISGLSAVYDGTPKTVSIRPKEGKSRGRIIVYYKGIEGTAYAINTAAPLAVGNYDVTFDVLAAEGFNAVTLRAGTLVIIGEQITGALIPVESDFDISGLQALANGKPKAVTISPKEGKSQGQISVYYEGANGTVYAKSADAPSEAGKYAVTFDLTEAEGFYAASGLSAGTLVISQIKTFNVDFEDQIWSDGNKGYAERTVTYRRYRWLISGVGTMDAGDRRSGARSLRLRGNNGDNCRIESITFFESGIESVSFDYASYSTHSGGRITLSYQIDGNHDNEDEDGGKDAEWIAIGEVTAPAWSGYMQKAIFENLGIAESARVKIAREGGPANYTTVNIDNIIISSLSSEPDNKGGDDSDLVTLNHGDLSIHFLELGNKYTGDCVYVNYGDIDILIDAG
ncbi:MAG: MBG domain-containing protein, partial [Treponema sp.]|nr:MBG domain-containing protein [Treponema sp.]